MADGQRTVHQKYVWKVMFSQQSRSDGSGRVDISKTAADGGKPVLRLVLGLGMIDGILEIDVGIDGSSSWRGRRSSQEMVLESLRRQGR